MNLLQNPVFTRHVRKTPLLPLIESKNLLCKLECCQAGGSFKIRGSLSTLLDLAARGDKKGVITASMGNTASGLAYAGKLFHYPVAVVMPETVSATKLAATRRIGAEVILKGQVGDEALKHAFKLAQERNILFVHPHKTLPFLEGNATIAREIVEDNPGVEQIYIPIGGGGLASGIAGYFKSNDNDDKIEIIGCQPEHSPVMFQSVKAGRIIEMESKPTLSDGTTGGIEAGSITFDICKETLDDYILVSEKEIAEAIQLVLERHYMVIEGAAALSVASFIKTKERFKNKNVVLIITGKRITPDKLKKIICKEK